MDVTDLDAGEGEDVSPTDADARPAPVAEDAPRDAAGGVSGWFSVDNDGVIRGWCIDRAQPAVRHQLSVTIDGELIGSAVADRPHPRLQAQGDAAGQSAFSILVPPRFRDGQPHAAAVTVATAGYEPQPLKTKRGDVQLSATPPRLTIQYATPDQIVAELAADAAPPADGGVDLWVDGRRVPKDRYTVATAATGAGLWSLRLSAPAGELLGWMARPLSLCVAGAREAGLAGAARPLLGLAVEELDARRWVLRVSGPVALPPAYPLTARLLSGLAEADPVRRRPLRFTDNAATLLTGSLDLGDRPHVELETVDGVRLGAPVPLAQALSTARLVPNGSFARWADAAPDGFDLGEGVTAARGYYAFAEGLRATSGVTGDTALLTVPEGHAAGQPLLRVPIARSAELAHEPVELEAGLVAQASVPLTLLFRLMDGAGREVGSCAFPLSHAWRHAAQPLLVDRPDGPPLPLTLEVALADDTMEPLFIGLAGLRLGSGEDASFADADVRAPGEFFGNLLVNHRLTRWPGGLDFADRRGRFEIAEGWQLYNRRSMTPVQVSAAPIGAGAPGYALSVAVPEVTDYCRLEIGLAVPAPAGFGLLAFTAACDPIQHKGEVATWAEIDRIYILRRHSGGADGSAGRDEVLVEIGRRVVLSGRWRDVRLEFAVPPVAADDTEEPAGAGGAADFLVLEVRRAVALRLHSPALTVSATPPPQAAARLELEDPNIHAQADAIRGIAAWIGPEVTASAAGEGPGPAPPREPLRWTWARQVTGPVEVAICVHNAIDETLACLTSLVGASRVPHTVRVIDDGSDADGHRRLAAFVRDRPWMTLEANPSNLGYTASANRAIGGSAADWVVLLNSDTLVTRGWLDGLLDVAAADPGVAMVGPVSNAATYQSVPRLHDAAGKWHVNPLPDGLDQEVLAAEIARLSGRHYPEVTLLNGFCTLVRRDAFVAVGGFDQRSFPSGYGEENDLCLRMRRAGHRLRVADHVYVYHQKSASFGQARRASLAKAGDRNQKALHPEVDFGEMTRAILSQPALVELRGHVDGIYRRAGAGGGL